VSREEPARNRRNIEIFWEIRKKVQKNEGVDCAIGGRTGTFCKDRAGHALLSHCSTNERSAFIAVPLPFRGDEDRIGGSAIISRIERGSVSLEIPHVMGHYGDGGVAAHSWVAVV